MSGIAHHEGHLGEIETDDLRTAIVQLLEIRQQAGIGEKRYPFTIPRFGRKASDCRLGGKTIRPLFHGVQECLPDGLARAQHSLARIAVHEHLVAWAHPRQQLAAATDHGNS